MLYLAISLLVVIACSIVFGGEAPSPVKEITTPLVRDVTGAIPLAFTAHDRLTAPAATTMPQASPISAEDSPPVSPSSDSGFFGNFFCFTSPNTVLTNYECW
jgi:hypothetical protein